WSRFPAPLPKSRPRACLQRPMFWALAGLLPMPPRLAQERRLLSWVMARWVSWVSWLHSRWVLSASSRCHDTLRQALAKQFGASDIVEERGEEGIARIKELTNG